MLRVPSVMDHATSAFCCEPCYECLLFRTMLRVPSVVNHAASAFCYGQCYECLLLRTMLRVPSLADHATSAFGCGPGYECLLLRRVRRKEKRKKLEKRLSMEALHVYKLYFFQCHPEAGQHRGGGPHLPAQEPTRGRRVLR